MEKQLSTLQASTPPIDAMSKRSTFQTEREPRRNHKMSSTLPPRIPFPTHHWQATIPSLQLLSSPASSTSSLPTTFTQASSSRPSLQRRSKLSQNLFSKEAHQAQTWKSTSASNPQTRHLTDSGSDDSSLSN